MYDLYSKQRNVFLILIFLPKLDDFIDYLGFACQTYLKKLTASNIFTPPTRFCPQTLVKPLRLCQAFEKCVALIICGSGEQIDQNISYQEVILCFNLSQSFLLLWLIRTSSFGPPHEVHSKGFFDIDLRGS